MMDEGKERVSFVTGQRKVWIMEAGDHPCHVEAVHGGTCLSILSNNKLNYIKLFFLIARCCRIIIFKWKWKIYTVPGYVKAFRYMSHLV
jgi:hypothetical protein